MVKTGKRERGTEKMLFSGVVTSVPLLCVCVHTCARMCMCARACLYLYTCACVTVSL